MTAGEWGIGALKGLMVIGGPVIKKGFRLKGTAWTADVVPTTCYLMALPVPNGPEGAILFQAFDDYDLKTKESRDLKEKLTKLGTFIVSQS